MVECEECGHRNEPGSTFCAACQHYLGWSGHAPPERGVPDEAAGPLPGASERGAPPPREAVRTVVQAINEGRELAERHGRPDLAARLTRARDEAQRPTATVVVVGEFKQGKSTLVNALLQTAVCPVDADVVTAVPTTVAYGSRSRVRVFAPGPDGAPEATEASLHDLRTLVSESSGRDGNQRYVEVQVPHRMLRSGLRLVDTPGVGGLTSAHGQLSLGAARTADGALVVTDASQELTRPELDFLRSVVERCPRTAVVMTKTDLYPEWRRVVALNEEHLRRADLDVPVIPLSSFLRLRAATDPSLNAESGFEPLVRFLATEIVAPRARRSAEAAVGDVDFVIVQLMRAIEAERAVLEAPHEAPAVVRTLTDARSRADRLASVDATWQQTLADGIQDLVADVDHDLAARLRVVVHDADAAIDEGDPKDTWPATEAWLRREVAAAAVANRDLLHARADRLADEVADAFDLDTGHDLDLTFREVSDVASSVVLPDAAALFARPSRLASAMSITRATSFFPMVLWSTAGAIAGMPVIAVGAAAVAVGAGIGRLMVREETKRQRATRQQQARAAARRFVDEVAFEMGKESKDRLRETQRQLRDEFQARAAILQRSAAAALQAAQRADSLPPGARTARVAEVGSDADRLGRARGQARSVLTAAGSTDA